MTKTVTFALDGEVTLAEFSKAVERLRRLMDRLGKDAAESRQIEWIIVGLDAGSATATLEGTAPPDVDVLPVIRAYEDVGKALESGQPIRGRSLGVKRAARQIANLVGGRITAIRFETADTGAIIRAARPASAAEGARVQELQPVEVHPAYGSVRGRIETVARRGGLRFTLYELNTDRAVGCYLAPEFESIMREMWGRLAIVEGVVSRDPFTGDPVTVRQVSRVVQLPERQPGSWREAIGAAPALPGSISPEAAIRRGRDE